MNWSKWQNLSPASQHHIKWQNKLTPTNSRHQRNFIDLPLKMGPIQCSETSAISTQTPGKHPKENILYLTQGESLKSRNQRNPFCPLVMMLGSLRIGIWGMFWLLFFLDVISSSNFKLLHTWKFTFNEIIMSDIYCLVFFSLYDHYTQCNK
jgi:hypothetical protein